MALDDQDLSFIQTLLTCPITFDLFVDPVLASDGHTYERSAIIEWIKNHDENSPMTRQPITLKELKSNRIAKQLVDRYRSSLVPNVGKELVSFSGDGTLLTGEQKLMINGLFLKDKQWKLIYRATKDGFKARDFHQNCDNRGATLTIIQTRHRFYTKQQELLFGGYTTVPWSSRAGAHQDSQAFLFLLSEDKITRFNLNSSTDVAVSHDLRSGPIFGKDDIHLCHLANENHDSYSKFPVSYKDTTRKGRKAFSKWKHFLVNEIEVYMVVT